MTNGAADSLPLLKLFIDTNQLWKLGLSIFCVVLAHIMLLRGSLTVELFYVLRANGIVNSQFFDVLYNTLNRIAEEGLCQPHLPLANIMFLGSFTAELTDHLLTNGAATALPL